MTSLCVGLKLARAASSEEEDWQASPSPVDIPAGRGVQGVGLDVECDPLVRTYVEAKASCTLVHY